MKKHLWTVLILTGSAGSLYAQDGQSRPLKMVAELSGSYKGMLPCTTCTGVEEVLELSYNTDTTGAYLLIDHYLGKNGKEITSASKREGEWIAVKDIYDGKACTMLVLNYDNSDKYLFYALTQQGTLLPLDSDKRPLYGDIKQGLTKQPADFK